MASQRTLSFYDCGFGRWLFFLTMKPRKAYRLWLAFALIFLSIYIRLQPISVKLKLTGNSHGWHGNISILLWHWPFNISYPLEGNVCLNKYGIPRCLLTANRSQFSQADVVVFHHHELKYAHQKLPLHLRRPWGQKWVWLSLEPPAVNQNVSGYNHLFNWTMSYRRDADIFLPYGSMIQKRTNETFHIPEKSSCLACWVVSNYKNEHNRSKVYHQLRKHIPIARYGKANRRPLGKEHLLPIIGRCHFYLAFENSIAKDYITEKLWRNAFQAGTVPVVLGPPRSNYEEFVPPDSFIHVDDFKSISELASKLKKLASNRTQYQLYFKWHKDHAVHIFSDWRERLCQICKKYNELPSLNVHHDLQGWAMR
ncbi:alpha-(1,3)-fucosyltransferase 7 isoform X2 [Alosa sapidissima]|uniref:alpha-(1,3)-fucosyltransferase 7 isoform X2 n=1 Tax=Alosa sapidissima TaxID=34773 RepID=UPI001C082293|nr:alpha-(1,3)-fucosyltransferase 7 isoform X2 [Alosa sapidissima]